MAEALTASQLATAERLLGEGLTLKKIAKRLGVSFGAACLGLFGGNQLTARGKAGREENPAPLTQQGFATPDNPGDGAAQSATLQSETSARVVPPRADTPPVNTHSQPEAAMLPQTDASRDAGALCASAEQAAVESSATNSIPVQRYRLVSPHGESLHQSERVLTRLPKFFWRGDAREVAALRRRKPQWRDLEAVEVLS